METSNTFCPDWFSPPGETVTDLLVEREISRADLAKGLGVSDVFVKRLLDGHEVVDVPIARKLVTIFGSTESFWLRREDQYRKDIALHRTAVAKEDPSEWLDELPMRELIESGRVAKAVEPVDLAVDCLKYFGVPSIRAWRDKYRKVLAKTAFRTSKTFASQPTAIAAWIRAAEIEVSNADVESWDQDRFSSEISSLRVLTRLSDPSDFIPQLKERCAACGVSLAVIRAPAGCRASGATLFLSPNRPLLLLSFRHLSDDHFWFSFFHEAGHLILHSDGDIFLEGYSTDSPQEDEANEFAASVLIPSEYHALLGRLGKNRREIMRFARDIGISAGIVVGQLQHSGRLRRNEMNDLKRYFRWQ